MDHESLWTLILSITICSTFVTMLAACLCCRRKMPKNELMGLEGRMVKLKNPDENPTNSTSKLDASADQTDHHHSQLTHSAAATAMAEHEKRASSATHRSLPDIPVIEQGVSDDGIITGEGLGVAHLRNGSGGGTTGDTNSDLYATVGDKIQQRIDGSTSNHHHHHHSDLGKQASISQHSSLSQADDISSPYASVRSPPHAYDKIRKAEHPYAQLQPTAQAATAIAEAATSRRASNESLLGTVGSCSSTSAAASAAAGSVLGDGGSIAADGNGGGPSGEMIPAASAIAGRISASQELPYMTPPIPLVAPTAAAVGHQERQQQQQHFSGDSQDSSKGYTSISVREPLANILAQTKASASARQQLERRKAREQQDSYYATVSDDSDEMYAAIEDPNNPGELYTSGSETYARIQPMVLVNADVVVSGGSGGPVAVGTVSVDGPAATVAVAGASVATTRGSNTTEQPPAPPVVVIPDPLPQQLITHSRQGSSSSSIGVFGSPKPEKRQANSPLPPTPKSGGSSSSGTKMTKGRQMALDFGAATESKAAEGATVNNGSGSNNNSNTAMETGAKLKSPSKDLEGMYAKVMKKNKLSNLPPESVSLTSPTFNRRPLDADSNMSNSGGSGGGLMAQMDRDEEEEDDDDEDDLMEVNHRPHHVPGVDNNYETINRKSDQVTARPKSGGTGKDPGYETIPADKGRKELVSSNVSAGGEGKAGAAKGRQSGTPDMLQ